MVILSPPSCLNPACMSSRFPYSPNAASLGPPATLLLSQVTFSMAGDFAGLTSQLLDENPSGSIPISLLGSADAVAATHAPGPSIAATTITLVAHMKRDIANSLSSQLVPGARPRPGRGSAWQTLARTVEPRGGSSEKMRRRGG